MKAAWARAAGLALAVAAAGWFAQPARGDDTAALYKAKCEICHAKDGSGNTDMGKQTKAHDMRSAEVQKRTDEQLIEITTKGKNDTMPAYKGKLTEAQIKALVAYIRGFAKK